MKAFHGCDHDGSFEGAPILGQREHEVEASIPKEIRDSLSMKAGDRMTFTLMPEATVVMRVNGNRMGTVESI